MVRIGRAFTPAVAACGVYELRNFSSSPRTLNRKKFVMCWLCMNGLQRPWHQPSVAFTAFPLDKLGKKTTSMCLISHISDSNKAISLPPQ